MEQNSRRTAPNRLAPYRTDLADTTGMWQEFTEAVAAHLDPTPHFRQARQPAGRRRPGGHRRPGCRDRPHQGRCGGDGRCPWVPVLALGVIDLHTHYDAQLTWDKTASPSPALGLTTVVIGNCGFGIAPTPANRRATVLANLSEVEAMSLDALHAGVNPQGFETFGEYLALLPRKLGVSRGTTSRVVKVVEAQTSCPRWTYCHAVRSGRLAVGKIDHNLYRRGFVAPHWPLPPQTATAHFKRQPQPMSARWHVGWLAPIVIARPSERRRLYVRCSEDMPPKAGCDRLPVLDDRSDMRWVTQHRDILAWIGAEDDRVEGGPFDSGAAWSRFHTFAVQPMRSSLTSGSFSCGSSCPLGPRR